MTSRTLKKQLREALSRRAFDDVSALAGRERRVLGLLVSLTFDAEPLIGWRAVEGIGRGAEVIARYDPPHVQEQLRRLRWLLNDESGGVCWRAPEAMAEIVRSVPDVFPDYVPLVVQLLVILAEEDLCRFRSGVLWAIGRLGLLAKPHIPDVLPQVEAALDDPDAQIRGLAVWCLRETGWPGALREHPRLRTDEEKVVVYEGGSLHHRRVRDLMPAT